MLYYDPCFCLCYSKTLLLLTNLFVAQHKPIIDPANENEVHHMLVNECHLPGDEAEVFEKWLEYDDGLCRSPYMPNIFNFCYNSFLGWTVGGEGGYCTGSRRAYTDVRAL